ncbi:MAG TPA: SMP-30/gluconolactonase/LRE family protein [Candidatus Cybelea sp.]|nr:SMP-30/gluconolactonase/LRE family protein [Candidatus Cybelea sp.]
MNTSKAVTSALVACAPVLGLAACSSGAGMQATPSSAIAPATTQSSAQAKTPTQTEQPDAGLLDQKAEIPVLAARASVTKRPEKRKTWFAKDAGATPRLLFISDFGSNDIDVFTMPAQTLKGQITGLSSPQGLCEDPSGDIWVANTGAQEMRQYSRTGTLLKTLSVPNEFPASCAVNRATGDLAVTNIESSSGPGNVVVFKNGSGSGTPYSNASIYQYLFAGYDDSGNLFFDGTDEGRSTSYFAELPAGSSSTKIVSLSNGTLHFPGMVQWYKAGKYVALGDQQCDGTASACIYWVSISGSTGSIIGTTNLSNYSGGQVCDLTQSVIAADEEKYVVGADDETCGYTPATTDRWAFPAGGSPRNQENGENLVEPIGAAISTK